MIKKNGGKITMAMITMAMITIIYITIKERCSFFKIRLLPHYLIFVHLIIKSDSPQPQLPVNTSVELLAK